MLLVPVIVAISALGPCDPSETDLCVRMEGVGSIGTPTITPTLNGYDINIIASGTPIIYVEGKNNVDISQITVNTSMGSLLAGASVAIGDNLAGIMAISNSSGLAGQIIINGDNNTPPSTWSGVISVGGAPLTDAPYYSAPSAGLGGGAIGLVPYRLYDGDCAPANNSYMTREAFEVAGAIVRYYGPVAVGNSLMLPIVQMRDPYDFDAWGNASGMFAVEVHPAGVAAQDRSVKITYIGTAGDLGTGWYRLHLQAGGLVCADVTNTPDVVGDYYFTIGLNCNGSPNGEIDAGDFIDAANSEAVCDDQVDCNCNRILDECEIALDGGHTDNDGDGVPDDCEISPSCRCDFNGDHVLNSQDFFDFLTCFFAESCPPGRSADFNHDGLENSQDFFDFLNCFFGGC